jgi:hypothetical protein
MRMFREQLAQCESTDNVLRCVGETCHTLEYLSVDRQMILLAAIGGSNAQGYLAQKLPRCEVHISLPTNTNGA